MPDFKKDERLSSNALIEDLFTNGSSFYVYPFKTIWKPTSDTKYPAQILISVPKKYIKNAVTRNLIRRRIREIYRNNKQELYQSLLNLNRNCMFALIYTSREVLTSSKMEPKIILLLQRLIQENDKVAG
jgi:ribonuclease P protein component